MKILLALLACAAAACGALAGGPAPRAKPTTGGIAGLARDLDSGDPISKAEIAIRTPAAPARSTTSSERGLYDLDRLAPGRYALAATFAGQTVDVENIDVRAGEITMVDLGFTLSDPKNVKIDFQNDTASSRIDRYRPSGLTDQTARIEGTVSDVVTRRRVPGAVIYAVDGAERTQQTVSDDHGRYTFEPLAPGTYAVSAYYSMGGRGQIEVRRSGIDVAGAEAVVVPLWIEVQR
ncbi:MAG: carboxypeptidase regulatory-like domain-containing protein [Deltaproteobacteria bacterium]|nr:carboxypeptidase regulatory-like domain-containing protein [Deltaproteobacteria bacterium]